MASFRYELYVDRGGTFTDVVCIDRDTGTLRTTKVTSDDDAPLRAARALVPCGDDGTPPPMRIVIGTTLATNALLERRGAPVVAVVDEGLEDVLEIGDQTRPELFASRVVPRERFTRMVLGVPVRIDRTGRVHGGLGDLEVRLRACVRPDDVVAVALRFAPFAPEVERAIESCARAAGARAVVCSHRVHAAPGYLARATTTVVEAYLRGPLDAAKARVARAFPGSEIHWMRSDGTRVVADALRGVDAVLSGPAGGTVAVAGLLTSLGLEAGIAFDMGGTSTDVAVVDASLRPSADGAVAGIPLRVPMVRVHTVAAGGGSVLGRDVDRLTVGPDSAGATPGPVCYGRGGRAPTLTDAALALGRIVARDFPIPLDVDASGRALAGLAGTDEPGAVAEVAAAYVEVGVAKMADAIRDVTQRRGLDPRGLPLVVYGGAGAQYAGLVARALGVRRALVPRHASVFSALGIGQSERAESEPLGAVRGTLDEARFSSLRGSLDAAADAALARLAPEPDERVTAEGLVVMRHPGTDALIELPLGESLTSLRARFDAAHVRQFGAERPEEAVEVVAARAWVRARRAHPIPPTARAASSGVTRARVQLERGRPAVEVDVIGRDDVPAEGRAGPLLVRDEGTTIVVEPGFVVSRLADGTLALDDHAEPTRIYGTRRDPVRVEVFAGAFMTLATEMGHVLRALAKSPNIRDRLDFSCAVFDAEGGLVANAPHIPVHLGALGVTVRAVLRAAGDTLRDGDSYLVNDPRAGGSHLPDVTVVMPVFGDGGALLAVLACRGHHPEVGGRTPGSMPAFSSTLEEEGVVIPPLRCARDHILDPAIVRAAFATGRMPSRAPDDNLREVRAQHDALSRGREALRGLCRRHGDDVVRAYMGHLQDVSEASVRLALSAHAFDPPVVAEDSLDDGTRIRVAVSRGPDGRLVVDFTGSAGPHPGNANAPRSVVVSAVLYVLRTWVGRALPLNEGFLRCVTLVVPGDSCLDPPGDAAVASGNVETSQRVVDVLVAAFGLGAGSQGTMNNLTIGDADFAYYETLGGGAGATPAGPGGSAVHTHMTNSRLTDVEVLEEAYPMHVRRTSIRRGSGGAGRHPGGDGLVRELVVERAATVSIVAERRSRGPRGVHGGGDGAPGRDAIDGLPVPGRVERRVAAGAVVRIETPGGGGYGAEGEAGIEPDPSALGPGRRFD